MASELIATGSSVTASSDITLADGEALNIGLKEVSGDVAVAVQMKDDDAAYNDIGVLSSGTLEGRSVAITGPGVFRVQRRNGTCGVFSA